MAEDELVVALAKLRSRLLLSVLLIMPFVGVALKLRLAERHDVIWLMVSGAVCDVLGLAFFGIRFAPEPIVEQAKRAQAAGTMPRSLGGVAARLGVVGGAFVITPSVWGLLVVVLSGEFWRILPFVGLGILGAAVMWVRFRQAVQMLASRPALAR